MIQKIKSKLIILSSVVTLLAPATLSLPAYAATPAEVQNDISRNLKCGSNVDLTSENAPGDQATNEANACAQTPATGTNDLNGKIRQVLNILSAIVGVIAVIMIIFGGLRYVASGGKQESVSSAKNTILYAVIGLVIVALAQAIVHFVLRSAT